MSVEAAQLMIVGFEGTEPSPDFEAFVRETPPAGIVFFRRNFESTDQIASLVRRLRALFLHGETPLFAIDQEGGRVQRLKAPHCPQFPDTPPMEEVATAGSQERTRNVGKDIGSALGRLGFNLNFAPVLDVNGVAAAVVAEAGVQGLVQVGYEVAGEGEGLPAFLPFQAVPGQLVGEVQNALGDATAVDFPQDDLVRVSFSTGAKRTFSITAQPPDEEAMSDNPLRLYPSMSAARRREIVRKI